MSARTRFAVFASGAGTNFGAIVEAVASGAVPGACALLVCDVPGAGAIERARRAGIPVLALDPRDFQDKSAYERQVLEALRKAGVEWIVLAGYMRLVGPTLLCAFPERIVNIHPSLLPAFPGLDAIGQALRAGAETTGVTVHLVDAGMDTGPILAQRAVRAAAGDPVETARRIQRVEHALYPEVLASLFQASRQAKGGDR